jgi:hypothetical protein
MKKPDPYASYHKVREVINSCTTIGHIITSLNLISNYLRMFPNQESCYRSLLNRLEVQRTTINNTMKLPVK